MTEPWLHLAMYAFTLSFFSLTFSVMWRVMAAGSRHSPARPTLGLLSDPLHRALRIDDR